MVIGGVLRVVVVVEKGMRWSYGVSVANSSFVTLRVLLVARKGTS